MSEIKHILLRPAEGDPHGLLREELFVRPPLAWTHEKLGHMWEVCRFAYPLQSEAMGAPCRYALVLAWDGKPVEVGCFRADRRNHPVRRGTVAYVFRRRAHLFVELITSILAGELRAWSDMPKTNVDALADLVPGTLVLLDAEGKEVSDGK